MPCPGRQIGKVGGLKSHGSQEQCGFESRPGYHSLMDVTQVSALPGQAEPGQASPGQADPGQAAPGRTGTKHAGPQHEEPTASTPVPVETGRATPNQLRPKPPVTEEDSGDASRRTRLANERTYLAWWRTGLTAFAVSVGAGKLVPVLAGDQSWTYQVLGIAFAVLGSLCILYAFIRQREVERAISRGSYTGPDQKFVALLSVLGVLLGAGLVVALLF